MKYKCFKCGENKETTDVVLNLCINLEDYKQEQIHDTIFQKTICGWCYQEIIRKSKEVIK